MTFSPNMVNRIQLDGVGQPRLIVVDAMRWAIFSVLGAFLIVLPLRLNAHSPHDVIESVAVTSSGNQPAHVFAITGELLVRSEDAGQSWDEITSGFPVVYPLVDVSVSTGAAYSVAVATDGQGIFGSQDAGSSWFRITDATLPSRFSKVQHMSSAQTLIAQADDGHLWYTNNFGVQWRRLKTAAIAAFATTPCADGEERIWVATKEGVIRRLPDGDLQRLPDADAAVVDIAVHGCGRTAEIVVGTSHNGVFYSSDAGGTYKPYNDGLTSSEVTDIAWRSDGSLLLTTWDEALFHRGIASAQWRRISDGFSTDIQATKPGHKSPQFKSIGLDVSGRLESPIFVAGFDGLFRSTPAGEAYEQVSVIQPGRIMDFAAVAVAQDASPCLALATYGGGSYLNCSGDWKAVNEGLSVTRMAGLDFSASFRSDQKLYTGVLGSLLQRRIGDADRWKSLELKHPFWWETLNRIAGFLRHSVGVPKRYSTELIDAVHSGKMFPVKIMSVAGWPNHEELLMTTRRHGFLAVNTETGRTRPVWQPEFSVGRIVASPDFSNDRTFFAATRTRGVWVSRDAGESWLQHNQGLDYLDSWERELQGAEHSAELARSKAHYQTISVSPDYATHPLLLLGSREGIFRSDDGAVRWQKSATSLQGPVLALSILRTEPGSQPVVLASTRGNGIYRSTDGGQQFVKLDNTGLMGGDWVVNFTQLETLGGQTEVYAHSENRLWRSDDAGLTWQEAERTVRYEGSRGVVQRVGSWEELKSGGYSASSAWASSSEGSELTLPFYGTGVEVMGSVEDTQRIVATLDGVVMKSAGRANSAAVDIAYASRQLPCGAHLLKLAVVADGANLVVDALDVLDTGCKKR